LGSVGSFSIFSVSIPFLFILVAAPVGAAPSLSLNPQSNAQYELTATLRSVQSCTASPLNYTVVTCGPATNARPSEAVVNVTDDGICSTGDANCKFVPLTVTINAGEAVEWRNLGSLNHTITSNTNSSFFGFSLFNNSLASKTFYLRSIADRTFNFPGTYSYLDQRYTWMLGNVIVNPAPPPRPRVQETNATGPVGWTVVGLDQSAVLSFNHALSIRSNSTGTKQASNESGTLEETIDLGTREESPGLTSQFLYLPPILFPFQGLRTSGFGYPSYNYYYPPQEVYTIWWVNGPLQSGSTVRLLTATASVRSSGTFPLGSGSFPSWIVASQFAESYNQSQPNSQPIIVNPFPIGIPVFQQSYPVYYTASTTNTVSINLDYGQQSDLLLSASASLRNYDTQVTFYPQGSYIYPYSYGYSYPVQASHNVTVTNTYETSLSVSLKLTSTNLDLSKRMTPPPSSSTGGSNPPPGGGANNPAANAPSSMLPWIYLAVGAVMATGVGAVVGTGVRIRRKTLRAPMGLEPIPSSS
jgi:plastocyanin